MGAYFLRQASSFCYHDQEYFGSLLPGDFSHCSYSRGKERQKRKERKGGFWFPGRFLGRVLGRLLEWFLGRFLGKLRGEQGNQQLVSLDLLVFPRNRRHHHHYYNSMATKVWPVRRLEAERWS